MLKQLLLSAKLGDGCYVKQCKNAILIFNSTTINYLVHKKVILDFLKDVKNLLVEYDIKDMFYKAEIPSTTIPKGSTLK